MRTVSFRIVAIVVAAIVLSVVGSPARATLLTVADSSFEDFALDYGGFWHLPNGAPWGTPSDTPIPGWDLSKTAGWIGTHYTDLYTALPAGNGVKVAYTDGGGSISQTLATTLAANTRYTLNVDIGRRNDGNGDSAAWGVELLAGATSLGYSQVDVGGIPLDSWSTMEVTYTTGASVAAGQALRIVLTNPSGGTANFDNARLDASAVPEPSAFVFLASGLAGLLAYAWRKRK